MLPFRVFAEDATGAPAEAHAIVTPAAATSAPESSPSPSPSASPTPASAAPQQVTVTAPRASEGGATATSDAVDLTEYATRATRLAEILDTRAGVDVLDFGAGIGSRVRIRGASAEETLVVVDGVRMNPAGGGGADLEAIPRDLIGRVEIVRGAGAARWGAGALGGVVVFESGGAARSGGATFTGGSFGTFRGSASAVARQGGWTFDATARQERVGDRYRYYDAIDGTERERVNAGSQAAGGALGARGPLAGGELEVRAFGTSRVGGAPGPSEFPTREARHGEDEGTAVARWTVGDVGPGLALEVIGSERIGSTSFRDPQPVLGFAPISTSAHESASAVGALLRTTRPGVGIVAGVDARDERIGGRGFGAHARDVGGAHASALAELGQVELEGALRAEAADDERANGAGRTWDGALLPSAGVAWHAGRGLTLKAHAGRAWRLPTFEERWLPNEETVAGNAALKPENAWTGDAGASVCFGDGVAWGLSLDAQAFATRLTEAIVFAPVSLYRWEAVNSGAAWTRGGELAAGFVTPVLQVTASATHTETRRDETNRPLPGWPRDKAAGRVAARLFGDALEPFVEARWQGVSWADFYGNLTIPSGTLVGGGVTASLERGRLGGFSLTLEGTNLGNADVRDARYFPQPGPAFWLTFSWRAPRGAATTGTTTDTDPKGNGP